MCTMAHFVTIFNAVILTSHFSNIVMLSCTESLCEYATNFGVLISHWLHKEQRRDVVSVCRRQLKLLIVKLRNENAQNLLRLRYHTSYNLFIQRKLKPLNRKLIQFDLSTFPLRYTNSTNIRPFKFFLSFTFNAVPSIKNKIQLFSWKRFL